MTKPMTPVISYYGGKQRLASKIIPYIPKHTVYCEPFCGGAAVLFKKPWPKVTNVNHYREVINDTDGHLINFYTQLRDNGPALIEKIQLTLYSEEEHRVSKKLDIDDDLERARRYYVNIQQSFAHMLSSGWRKSIFSENSALAWVNKISKLSDYLERVSYIHISNTDAIKCIKQWDSPQTFFYVDPPYPGTNQGHYGGYTTDDFRSLIDALKTAQGSFILSCYDQPDMPEKWIRVEFDVVCSSSGKGKVNNDRTRKATSQELGNRKRKEIIWAKPSVRPRPEIIKLYESGAYDCFTGKEYFRRLREERTK